jgi:hypothetical protein
VVVAHEVKDPVSEQEADLGEELSLPRPGLAKRRRKGDHDVPEQSRHAGLAPAWRRLVLVPVLAIQHLHPGVVDEQHAELRVLEPERTEHPIRDPAELRGVELRRTPGAPLNEGRHGSSYREKHSLATQRMERTLGSIQSWLARRARRAST